MLTKLALLALALYALVCLLVFLGQRRLLYFPGPAPQRGPEGLGLPWRDVTLETEDGQRLAAWWFEPSGTGRPRAAVLVSHGNAGSIESRLFLARALASLGCAVLLYDYRGFGASTGSPDEQGTYRDGRAAYAWLRGEGWEPERIVLYGESLGGGVAVELATRLPAAALIVESTFASVPALAAELYPWLPARWLARDRYDNAAKLPGLRLPLLILHSPEDEIVPFRHAERLHAAAPAGTELVRTGGGHNDGGFTRRASDLERVGAFLDRVLPPAAGR